MCKIYTVTVNEHGIINAYLTQSDHFLGNDSDTNIQKHYKAEGPSKIDTFYIVIIIYTL